MKQLSVLVAVLCTLIAACAPHAEHAPPVDPVSVTVWRDFELTIHGDTDFAPEGQRQIENAARNIRRLTHDRARLSVVFDLDFDSLSGLAEHKRAGHSQIIAVTSTFDIAKTIDATLGGPGSVLAATAPLGYGDARVVVLIVDRIDDADFENVVTHEFGHVIGLPDLPERGSIMSGTSVHGTPNPADWTPADVALCRRYRYCD